jgi:dihydrofolate reductase
MQLVVSEFLSLDGVMQAPGAPDEDREGGFAHGGWSMPYFDDVAGGLVFEAMKQTRGFLFGRRTYEIMAAHWPFQPDDDPFAATLNGLPKWVASTTLGEPLAWEHSTLLKGDVAAAIAEVKESEPDGNLVVLGSGGLVQALIEHDLVDRYSLMIDPLLLGDGKRLFRGGNDKVRLRLVDSTTTGTGVIMATYEPERSSSAGAHVGPEESEPAVR